MGNTVIDRRANPSGRNLPNRQKFLRRARKSVQDAVKRELQQRKIDATGGADVSVTPEGVDEPLLHHDRKSGRTQHVVPGNKNYTEGDEIPRQQGGEGQGGREGSPDGNGEDEFEFTLSAEEFFQYAFEGLELPDLRRKGTDHIEEFERHRAGYSVAGTPSNLALKVTMRRSIGRRIALGRPKEEDVEAMREKLEEARRNGDEATIARLTREIEGAECRMLRIAYIDPIDVRYRRFDRTPRPNTQAVMFCLMDVSGSMTEGMKDLAKRFFMLLHVFLVRKYKHVDVVFIRHDDKADEVDHDRFFYERKIGGTVVSTGLEKVLEVARLRYPNDRWNIYVAQASDGDNYDPDNPHCVELIDGEVLPLCQQFVYVEIGDAISNRETNLWRTYTGVSSRHDHFKMAHLVHVEELIALFHEIWKVKGAVHA